MISTICTFCRAVRRSGPRISIDTYVSTLVGGNNFYYLAGLRRMKRSRAQREHMRTGWYPSRLIDGQYSYVFQVEYVRAPPRWPVIMEWWARSNTFTRRSRGTTIGSKWSFDLWHRRSWSLLRKGVERTFSNSSLFFAQYGSAVCVRIKSSAVWVVKTYT